MSFFFNWLDLEYTDLKLKLSNLLSQIPASPKSSSTPLDGLPLPQRIKLQSLNFGTQSPNFELLEVPELSTSKFKGLFKFNYQGQLTMTITAEIEINALNLIPFDRFTKPHFILSGKSTIIPVDFEIKDLKIDALITVVYINDPITGQDELIVVFNEDPEIQLNLKTSIDELIDEDVFESIKADALQFAKEVIKGDLPKFLRDASKFKDLEKDIVNAESNKFQAARLGEDEDGDSETGSEQRSMTLSKAINLDFLDYDTLALNDVGFVDVCQRNSIEKFGNLDNKSSTTTGSAAAQKKHTRRKIKMSAFTKPNGTSTPPLQPQTTVPSPTKSIVSNSTSSLIYSNSTDTDSHAYASDAESTTLVLNDNVNKSPPSTSRSSLNVPLNQSYLSNRSSRPSTSSRGKSSSPSTPNNQAPCSLQSLHMTEIPSLSLSNSLQSSPQQQNYKEHELSTIERYLSNNNNSNYSNNILIDPYENLLQHPATHLLNRESNDTLTAMYASDGASDNYYTEDNTTDSEGSFVSDQATDTESMISSSLDVDVNKAHVMTKTRNNHHSTAGVKSNEPKRKKKRFRSRVTSSNYINLGEFKGFLKDNAGNKNNKAGSKG
ncbi:hypothetical protein WICPIJ_004654 [Wickerhamomyces pijperi]|uniref:SMP-LTD domain-containing protein n=1 Tax=Wickerhamomyces pijperi TaxID=599730 RepID=A0A9P8TLU8_WICPI|nr:hypothetical protein WICPIJ_004654 [Wickerhamomyces pijperi]